MKRKVFRKMLTARIAELERIIRQRDGIAIERSADLLEEVQCASERALAVSNWDRDCSPTPERPRCPGPNSG